MAGLPDPETAYALLIGVAEYQDRLHKPLLACHRSVVKLAELLRGTGSSAMWQLPAERIKRLGPEVTAPEAREALKTAVEAPDLKALLVCISCHGHRYDEDGYSPPGLHLAMTDSINSLPGSYLHFDEVSNLLGQAARDRDIPHILLIVDSCWSDDAKLELGQGTGTTVEIDHLAVPGAVTLTATRRRVKAWPILPGKDWTAFLGALIGTVEDGIPGAGEILTAKQVFTAAHRRLTEAQKDEPNIPEPRIYAEGVSEIPLCRNRQYRKPVKVKGGSAAPAGEVPAFRDAEDCFRAIQAAHRDKSNRSIPVIVRSFCGQAEISASEIAGLTRSLEESEFSPFVEFAYAAVCADRSPAEIAGFAHSLHHNGSSIDAGRIASGLGDRARAALDIHEVYQSLQVRECPQCVEAAEAISAIIVDDPDLSRVVLSQWR